MMQRCLSLIDEQPETRPKVATNMTDLRNVFCSINVLTLDPLLFPTYARGSKMSRGSPQTSVRHY